MAAARGDSQGRPRSALVLSDDNRVVSAAPGFAGKAGAQAPLEALGSRAVTAVQPVPRPGCSARSYPATPRISTAPSGSTVAVTVMSSPGYTVTGSSGTASH